MKTLVVGVGSSILGDDGVGVRAVRMLAAGGLPEKVELLELGTAGLSLLDHIKGHDRLILIDAIVSGAPAGTVHELEGAEVAKAAHLGPGHEADLPTTLEVGRKLLGKEMPQEVIVLAVEGRSLTDFSEALSPEVEEALTRVMQRIRSLLDQTPAEE